MTAQTLRAQRGRQQTYLLGGFVNLAMTAAWLGDLEASMGHVLE